MKLIYKLIVILILILCASMYFSYHIFPQGNIAILRTTGGLGNQLFQYSAAYSFAKKNNLELYILNGNNHKSSHRPFLLDNIFDVKENILTYGLSRQFAVSLLEFFSLRSFTRIDMNNIDNKFDIKQDGNQIFFIKNWFEALDFFKEYQDEIKDSFYTKNINITKKLSTALEQVSMPNSTCIHFRLTDFHQVNNVLDFSYYKKSIEIIKDKLPDSQFFLFSDNISEAAKILDNNIDYHNFANDKFNAIEDFILLSNCSNIITANSTFSWWAAFLNKNANIIITPNFLTSGKFNSVKEKFPANWIILQNY
jgi:hypothetical protein